MLACISVAQSRFDFIKIDIRSRHYLIDELGVFFRDEQSLKQFHRDLPGLSDTEIAILGEIMKKVKSKQ
jgi:hypothetical protein